MDVNVFGRIAFYIGLVISVIAGWMDVGATGLMALAALGLVVGLLNVTTKEAGRFLLAALVLTVVGLALRDLLGMTIARILTAFIAFNSTAALVVALKEVYSIEKRR